MDYRVIQPSIRLKPFVRHYWILDVSPKDLPYVQHLTPYGRLELFFYFKQPGIKPLETVDPVSRDKGLFSGFFHQSMMLNHSVPFRAVGVSFHPWAGNALFQIPANCFSNASTEFSDLDSTSSLRDQLLESNSDREIAQCFERYLLNKLQASEIDEVAAFVTKEILKGAMDNNLHTTISQQVGLSKRRIEQRFLASVGVSMGYFKRISMFEKAVKTMALGQPASMTQVGIGAGYYDQSHFIREFKKFSTLTPRSFLQSLAMKNKSELTFISD